MAESSVGLENLFRIFEYLSCITAGYPGKTRRTPWLCRFDRNFSLVRTEFNSDVIRTTRFVLTLGCAKGMPRGSHDFESGAHGGLLTASLSIDLRRLRPATGLWTCSIPAPPGEPAD